MTAALGGHDGSFHAAVVGLRCGEDNFQRIDRAADRVFIGSTLALPGRVVAPGTVNCEANRLRHKRPMFCLLPSGRAEERKGRERQSQRSMALPSSSDSLRLSERSDAGAQRVPQRLTALSTAGRGRQGRVLFPYFLGDAKK
jgi:hypothetical protein